MIHTSSRRTSKSTSGLQCQSNWMMRASSTSPRATVIAYRYTAAQPKCCAPQLPRQFGEVELVVFARDVVSKTLTLFLQQSTKAEVGISAYWSVNPVEETITVPCARRWSVHRTRRVPLPL